VYPGQAEIIVKSFYQKYLNREPDEGGLSHYSQRLVSGEINEIELERILTNSDEYKANQQKLKEQEAQQEEEGVIRI